MRRYLVTGGAGFIGSNFVRHVLEAEVDARITNLDALTYAGVGATLAELNEHERHVFVHGDIRDRTMLESLVPGHDVVVNFAAETHVDRSVVDSGPFVSTNVMGTATLLDVCMRVGVPTFVQVSTDEVYGSIEMGQATEQSALRPSSPYSASKAGADLLAMSYGITHDYPVIVTRCTNNYGPYQHPEKLIPRFVSRLLGGKPVPLYGDGANQRDWLFVDDHCRAIRLLTESGAPGEIYNIGADAQVSNLDITRHLLAILELDESYIEYVADRPGHDFRYAVDSSKLRSLGWTPKVELDDGLERTVAWYRARGDWWESLAR